MVCAIKYLIPIQSTTNIKSSSYPFSQSQTSNQGSATGQTLTDRHHIKSRILQCHRPFVDHGSKTHAQTIVLNSLILSCESSITCSMSKDNIIIIGIWLNLSWKLLKANSRCCAAVNTLEVAISSLGQHGQVKEFTAEYIGI